MEKFAISLALVASCAFGASDEAAIQSTFVTPWVQAIQSKDKAGIERTFHPAVRACMNAGGREFFDNWLDREAQSPPKGAYLILKLAPMTEPPPAFLPEDGFPYPVKPTYQVQIEFEQSAVVFHLYLAPSNGTWFEVGPCPNEKGMAFFHEQLIEGAKQKEKTARLLADLKDPLRSQLTDLLRQQQKIDAVKKYQAAAGVDLTTAVGVIDALQKSDH